MSCIPDVTLHVAGILQCCLALLIVLIHGIENDIDEITFKLAEYDFIEQVSLDELYERSDVISIHCPLTDETKNMVDKEAFEKMKDGVIIINTARGAIIDETELVKALNSGKVYAAGLDVVAGEPLQEPCELMKCKNTRITEHIAWAPVESRIRSIKIACQNFINWKEGHPTSVVSA